MRGCESEIVSKSESEYEYEREREQKTYTVNLNKTQVGARGGGATEVGWDKKTGCTGNWSQKTGGKGKMKTGGRSNWSFPTSNKANGRVISSFLKLS